MASISLIEFARSWWEEEYYACRGVARSSSKIVKSIIFIPLFASISQKTLSSLSLLLSVNTLRVPFRFGSLGLSGRKLQLTCDDHYESIQFSPEVTLRLMRDALLLPISSHSWNFSHLFFCSLFFVLCLRGERCR